MDDIPRQSKEITKESISKHTKNNSHLCNNLSYCAIGEDIIVSEFYRRNKHIDRTMFNGILIHLIQDKSFDKFIRSLIKTENRFEDKYEYNGEIYNGEAIREIIEDIEQQGIYILSELIYNKYGIVTNNDWINNDLKNLLYLQYTKELADKTISFMKIKDEYNSYISNIDWSHKDTVISTLLYNEFYEGLSKSICQQFNKF